MDTLGKLFGSPARVKILRLFMLNPNEVFETREVRLRSQVPSSVLGGELVRLGNIGFLKQKTAYKTTGRTKNGRIRKKKIKGWNLNPRFTYLDQLKALLISKKAFEKDAVAKRFQNAGRVKLLVVSGIFLQRDDSRVDILIVGDYLKKPVITRVLKILESEIGKDLKYGIFRTREFLYRLDVYDRLVRDILDYPHEKVINKLGIK